MTAPHRSRHALFLIVAVAFSPACGSSTISSTCGDCASGDAEPDAASEVSTTPSEAALLCEPPGPCTASDTEASIDAAPETVSYTCAEAVPTPGAPCDQAGVTCDYASVCGDAVDYATCDDGVWVVDFACAPSIEDCPAEEPADGSACGGTLDCSWLTNACGTNDIGTCVASATGGTWSIYPGICIDPTCPATVPTRGSPCSFGPTECNYENGCGGLTGAVCEAGHWSVFGPTSCTGS